MTEFPFLIEILQSKRLLLVFLNSEYNNGYETFRKEDTQSFQQNQRQ